MCKTWRTQSESCTWRNSVTGQQLPKMYSLPAQMTANGLTSCKVWLVSVERCRCSNEAKMRKPLKFAGVPQTRQSISADSGPKFTILWEHVEEILLLSKFFLIVDNCLSCEDTARQSCAMVPTWRFFASSISVSSTFQTCILNSH